MRLGGKGIENCIEFRTVFFFFFFLVFPLMGLVVSNTSSFSSSCLPPSPSEQWRGREETSLIGWWRTGGLVEFYFFSWSLAYLKKRIFLIVFWFRFLWYLQEEDEEDQREREG